MEKKRLSVGFADLARFNAATRDLSDEDAVALLEIAFRTAGDAVVAHGGQIRKYVGDALLFTAPDAVEAATAAREIVDGFGRDMEGYTIRFRVGMATGDVVIAEIGHPSFRSVDIFGDTVNRAAQLVGNARDEPSGIALCPETQRLVGGGS